MQRPRVAALRRGWGTDGGSPPSFSLLSLSLRRSLLSPCADTPVGSSKAAAHQRRWWATLTPSSPRALAHQPAPPRRRRWQAIPMNAAAGHPSLPLHSVRAALLFLDPSAPGLLSLPPYSIVNLPCTVSWLCNFDLGGAAAPCVHATANPSYCALNSVLISADLLSLYFVDMLCGVKKILFNTATMAVT